MKSITIAGNIGKDAEVRSTQGGDKVTGWTVAVEDRTGKEKSTIWFDCTLWGKRGESLAQYLTKGSKVCVSGELSKREHDGKTYLTVRAEQVTLMGGKPDAHRDDDRGHDPTGHQDRRGGAPAGGNPMDDEIPF
jgi:single-strand DNA-binding protein